MIIHPPPIEPVPNSRSSVLSSIAALGATVSDIDLGSLPAECVPSYSPLAKTKFSMVLPEVEKSLREWGTKSVVLFGIEVRVRRRDLQPSAC